MRRALNIYLLLPLLAAPLAVLALVSPENFLKAGVLAIALTIMALICVFPATFLGIVILLSIFAYARFGPQNLDTTTLHRVLILLALAAHVWRYGIVWRLNRPILALLVMFLLTLVAADPFPSLSKFQMIKSLVSLSLPFLFLNCVYRRDAIDRYLTLIAFLALISAVVGIPLDMAGITQVASEEYTGAVRLKGTTISAYLAFFAYIAFFVCLYQIVTRGRHGYYLLAGVNLIIILMTGTRTSMMTAALLISGVMLFAPQHTFSISSRLKVAFAGAMLVAVAVLFLWPSLEARFTGAESSGRTTVWPVYLAAIDQSPWFGRGIGAGPVLVESIRDDWRIPTKAAHNEYIRISLDAGIIGLLILLAAMAWWVRSERRFMRREERLLFLTFMLTFALASFVDNTLTSPPTVVVFFTLALMIQRARQRDADRVQSRAIGQRPQSIRRLPSLPQPG